MKKSCKAWAEVDLSAVAHNTRVFRRMMEARTKLMAVVKADAYGHGMKEVAREVLSHGADCLGVFSVEEALALRREGFGVPVLIMGFTPHSMLTEAVKRELSLTVFSLHQAEALSDCACRVGKPARLHLKIDTGMGRLGFLAHDTATLDLIKRIAVLPFVILEGIYTHFALADSEDKDYTWQQLIAFKHLTTCLKREGIEIPLQHTANSAAAIDLPETHLDMVRLGLALYGCYPEGVRHNLGIRPALTVKSRIVSLKSVPAGTFVSYGCTYRTAASARLACIPLGYASGYSRQLSNQGEVLVRGKRKPVAGRICMNQTIIDVSGPENFQLDDEVVVLGKQGKEEVSAGELAQKIDTISYEILCSLGSRLPRSYIFSTEQVL